MSNTQYILDFVINAKFSDFSEQARTEAKMGMSDCMGVTLAGRRSNRRGLGKSRTRRGASDGLGPRLQDVGP